MAILATPAPQEATMYRSPFVSSLLTAAVLLTGCGGEDSTQTSPAASERPAASVVQAEPSTSAPLETPTGTPTEATDAEAPAEATDAEATSGDGSGSGRSGTEGLPGWPIESTPVHGDKFWAAYVAVGAPGDPALQRVLEEVQQLWPGAGLGELGCDEGAAAALGRAPTDHAVAVYFVTEQHTTEFRRRWEAPFVGVVRVTTLCAD
jgi:hypothetical protein